MTTRADLEATATAYAETPLAKLYQELGMAGGPTRIRAHLAGRDWPPRLLLALDRHRRGESLDGLPGSPDAQQILRDLGIPLSNSHLTDSPLRTG
ncbi:MAG: hypothetical protein AAFY02_15185 [Pseudomonadota bacterium]